MLCRKKCGTTLRPNIGAGLMLFARKMGETVCCPLHPEENSNISCPLCEALFGQAVAWPTAEEAAARIDHLDGVLSKST